MKLIPLTRGKYAKVDDEDFEYLNQFKWCVQGKYAGRLSSRKFGKRSMILMHREILHTPNGMLTDHIDEDGLNNQKYNIRVCTSSQNAANIKMRKANTSGFRGVRLDKRAKIKKWRVDIRNVCMKLYVGHFYSKEEAARAYDKKATELFGKFARLNFPIGE